MAEYDYIIVGAGSAGCTLAYRLGADPTLKILVLEAGGPDNSPIIKIPLTWGLILKHRLYDWGYNTEPEPGMDGRRIECARGRVLGGCTSINGMAYARGMREDYDGWAQELGLNNWSYDNVLPYFERSESWEGGADEFRGSGGPLTVTRLIYEDPLLDAFMQATELAGYTRSDDYNGASAEGFGPMQVTIRRGRRWSAASAYLRPAVARKNVTVCTGALVHKVVFEGNRAVGVEFSSKGQLEFVRAGREVVLCGGVVNSPQLLMLSGIGSAQALQGLGIEPMVDLPGVGENLHDHIVCDVRWRRSSPGPLYRALRLDRIAVDVLRTWMFGTGLSGKIPAAAVGLVRSRQNLALPDLQLMLAAAPMTAGPHFGPFLKPYVDAFAIKGVFLAPESRGRIRLSSADPTKPPLIQQNFLSAESDRLAVREMVRTMRRIGGQLPLASFISEELAPGASAVSDEAIDAFIRNTAITLHHPAGTCKMAVESDPLGVLDQNLCVRGVDGLRVVDGSAIPKIVRGPINAPIIMMAEKIADDMLGANILAH
ncbi:GMC family oxidoreductase [Eoetvoesiella caeni]|uniref:Choline dehydrogenase n=1 Tax=Eoetvoesiella caeni TaxID=645616 RepID=A0A366H963_9BURK|nr:GMC family oxidoreductase N-terminal domain-containing protein [Eoetvoesiella caeni]MCI2809548.1 GMC family oxidoreductase N-terminal domain-containing protein [Eoetvoesiella caeni]RBP38809.1 choline dehydrogenase [Eoetvoesiella caeni]